MAKAPAMKQDYDEDARPSFSSILDMPASQAVRPKPSPVGTYLGMVNGHAEFGKSTKKGTGYARINWQLLEASDDVDAEALNVALTGPDGSVKPLREKFITQTFWDTPNSAYRLKDFLVALGIEETEDGKDRSLGDMLQEIPGRQAWIHIRHRASDDGEGLFAEVDRVIPVE
jgi:hypothetical protein